MSHNEYPPDAAENYPYKYGPDDDGTMPNSINNLASAVIGRRIVKAESNATIEGKDFDVVGDTYWSGYDDRASLVLTLDDGRRVAMVEKGECCAFTEIQSFLLNPSSVDHVITGVASEDGYTKWHIFADLGDMLTLDVDWSCGNPFYYVYGFAIAVSNTIEGEVVETQRRIE